MTAIEGTLHVDTGGATAIFQLVPDGETRFSVQVERGEMVHAVVIEAALEATVEVEVPPLVQLTHHPERTEELSGTVRVERPGVGRWVSETVVVTHEDGTTTEHEVSAYLTIRAQNGPGELHLRLPPRGAGGGRGRGSSSH